MGVKCTCYCNPGTRMCPANISRFKATMNGYIIFISTSTGCSSLCFPPYCYILPRKLLSWFLRQCRRAPVDTFNRYSDSRRSRRAKHVNKWLHSDNTELYNALTHFCVYCRVFSVASRVVAGYCRSFLQPLVAGGSWRESAWLWSCWAEASLLSLIQDGSTAVSREAVLGQCYTKQTNLPLDYYTTLMSLIISYYIIFSNKVF